MKPLMVLIGANGVGKTSLLDAVALLSASASGSLRAKLSQFGGISNLLTRGKTEELSFEVSNEAHEYEIKIVPNNVGYLISERYSEDGKLIQPDWEYNTQESTLSQVPKKHKQTEGFRRVLANTSHFRVLDVSERAPVRLPQQMRPAESPGKDGGNLVSFLYYLKEQDEERFEIIRDTLSAAFPGFEKLGFPPVAAGMLSMTWKDKNFSSPIYIHELSEGTLRFLWLVSILQSTNPSTITMIDEPEVSLHPELLSLLADLLREASMKTQLVVATHSDRLVSFLKPEEIVAMDIDEEGCTTANWGDEMDIERWLSEYSLDEVWRMGLMGARAI